MNLQRREEIRSLANYPSEWDEAKEYQDAMRELLAHIDALEQTAAERVIADGSRGPTPDYTGEGSAWVPPVEAPAVVIPNLDAPTICGLIETYADDPREIDGVRTAQAVMVWFRKNSRAIPADRVLVDGMVGVDREELMHLRGLEDCVRVCICSDVEEKHIKALDALRANQGGAPT